MAVNMWSHLQRLTCSFPPSTQGRLGGNRPLLGEFRQAVTRGQVHPIVRLVGELREPVRCGVPLERPRALDVVPRNRHLYRVALDEEGPGESTLAVIPSP